MQFWVDEQIASSGKIEGKTSKKTISDTAFLKGKLSFLSNSPYKPLILSSLFALLSFMNKSFAGYLTAQIECVYWRRTSFLELNSKMQYCRILAIKITDCRFWSRKTEDNFKTVLHNSNRKPSYLKELVIGSNILSI